MEIKSDVKLELQASSIFRTEEFTHLYSFSVKWQALRLTREPVFIVAIRGNMNRKCLSNDIALLINTEEEEESSWGFHAAHHTIHHSGFYCSRRITEWCIPYLSGNNEVISRINVISITVQIRAGIQTCCSFTAHNKDVSLRLIMILWFSFLIAT